MNEATSHSVYHISFYSSDHHRDLHSFPTRRSSDLDSRKGHAAQEGLQDVQRLHHGATERPAIRMLPARRLRSEEHTSELQSRFDLVCRLLLEKKNKIQ